MTLAVNTILQADVMDGLAQLPDGIIQTVVTSPPYWGLRDYGVENQLGLEKTPEEYIEKMVAVFREVRRVMRDDGTLWLNLGDSYAGGGTGGHIDHKAVVKEKARSTNNVAGLKPKDLCGIPWRLALALQADGWWLRSDIIWAKPNPMPESVTDRPTKSHEYIFLLTKRAKYFYDGESIREPHTAAHIQQQLSPIKNKGESKNFNKQGLHDFINPNGRNARTVWTIATQPYPEAHFATFPEELAERCIKAGSTDRACGVCGQAWERITKVVGNQITDAMKIAGCRKDGGYGGQDQANYESGKAQSPSDSKRRILESMSQIKESNFRPTCEHNDDRGRSIVLDPFMGSGTVAYMALMLGRDYIGIELNPEYIKLANKRLKPLGNRPVPQNEVLL